MGALFENYTKQEYIDNEVVPVEPMTAKEYLNEEELSLMLTSSDFIAEEKLDGTRATLHIGNNHCRIFSRRISKKTGWYAENSDSVPHIRDLKSEYLNKTIIDGEMLIDGRPFKDVSSTLNCSWGKAIERQKKLGNITFHAFDIIYFRGVYVAKMPLIRRKILLEKVVNTLKNEYVVTQPYFENTINIDGNTLTKEEYYNYIVESGGEGIMLKNKQGVYKHSRGREYTKLKKYETWDCIILDYVDPTIYYSGKELNNPKAIWNYWCDAEDESIIVKHEYTMRDAESLGLLPCTKHYCNDWIGTLKLGVIINDEEIETWKVRNPNTKIEIYETSDYTGEMQKFLAVVEAGGFDESTREYISNNKETLRGTVVEVKAQEVLKTGKLRHPRFKRFREDKENTRCTYVDHMRGKI